MRYTREDGCRAWLAYGGIAPEPLQELLKQYGCAEAIYDHFMSKGDTFIGRYVSERSLNILHERSQREQMHEMMVIMRDHQMGTLAMDDIHYPDTLLHIPQPPPLLFYRGDLSCLLGKCIGVVGSRKASPQGVESTKSVCRELSEAGVTVVSGFAVGIDTAAHEGCMEGGSPTVAVLGSGIDVDYPAENYGLKERILKTGGLLLTECAPQVKANQYVFQLRNRLISGLSSAILMMESRIKSGSMLTVHHALDQGKDVFAYPGTPGTEWAEGAHQLLREGARYFAYASDILEDLGWQNDKPRPTAQEQQSLPPLNDVQRGVYKALAQGEMSFDQLAAATGVETDDLGAALMMLQVLGLIKALPGKIYRRN